jgi:hypothetical protein
VAKQISKLAPIRPTDGGSWPETLSDPAKALLEYWVSKCDAGRYPSRSAIEPGEITHILPYVFIVERLNGEKSDYRFRLVGTQIVNIEGECTGRLLSELLSDRDRYPEAWKQYDECCMGVTYVRHQSLGWTGKKYIDYETVLLPLYGDGENVDYLIGTAYAALLPG